MISLENLKKEHEKIERELIELETIILEEDEVNYPNLLHIFKKLTPMWNLHENNEEKFLKDNQEKFPILTTEKLIIEHKELTGHRIVIKNAIESQSDFNIKLALETDGKMLIEKLRTHMNEENELFKKIQGKA